MSPLRCCLILCLAFAASPALAQEERSPGQDLAERLREFESWIILEEEAAPDPAFFKGEFGFLAFIENRSRIRSDRYGVVGSRLDDLEASQGLDSSGVGGLAEISLGGKVRGAASLLYYERGGKYEPQDDEVVFEGVKLADPGDFVRTEFQFLSLAGFVEWNAVYGRTYRIGLQGGLRYFRFDIEMSGARAQLQPPVRERDLRAELVSPFFGGLIELNPFPVFSVHTSVQFIIWSWRAVGLRTTRFLNFRMGVTVHPIPGLFGITIDYRFLVVRAESSSNTGQERIKGAMTSNGLGVSLVFSF